MGEQSKEAEKSMSGVFTTDMITPLQMEIIRAVNNIGTNTEFTAQTVLDAISPQEILLTAEDIDLLLFRMMQTMVECDLNPIYTHPKSKKTSQSKQTIFGRLLDLHSSHLPALGTDEETYVLDTPPIILRYEHAIETDNVENAIPDMPIFVAMFEDELRNTGVDER